jgi:hypothetical protein
MMQPYASQGIEFGRECVCRPVSVVHLCASGTSVFDVEIGSSHVLMS